MTPTKLVFLTLGLLAVVSIASAGVSSPPSTCCGSTCQQRCQTSVAQWKSSIASCGSNPGLIQAILKLLDRLLGGLLGWCGNSSGGVLEGLLDSLLGAVGNIVKRLLDLLLGKTTKCIAQKQCHAITKSCISKCQGIPGSEGLLGGVIKLLEDLLKGLFGSGATSGTCSGSDGGILDDLLGDLLGNVGGLLAGVLGGL